MWKQESDLLEIEDRFAKLSHLDYGNRQTLSIWQGRNNLQHQHSHRQGLPNQLASFSLNVIISGIGIQIRLKITDSES